MTGPRRPAWETEVRVAQPVTLELDGPAAFTALAALHEARRLLADPSPERAALLDALAALERELGLAIGADRARAFLRRRARRRRAAAG